MTMYRSMSWPKCQNRRPAVGEPSAAQTCLVVRRHHVKQVPQCQWCSALSQWHQLDSVVQNNWLLLSWLVEQSVLLELAFQVYSLKWPM